MRCTAHLSVKSSNVQEHAPLRSGIRCCCGVVLGIVRPGELNMFQEAQCLSFASRSRSKKFDRTSTYKNLYKRYEFALRGEERPRPADRHATYVRTVPSIHRSAAAARAQRTTTRYSSVPMCSPSVHEVHVQGSASGRVVPNIESISLA